MAHNFLECVEQLMKNDKEEFLKAANLLVRIARNIINNPGVEKYQSIQIGSKTFMGSLLPVDGAVQCLLEMGFEESGERFEYQNINQKNLQNMKSMLEKAIQKMSTVSPSPQVHEESASRRSETETYKKIVSHFQHVLAYENETLQTKARSVIPLERLSKKANEKLRDNPQFTTNNGNIPLEYDDCMILALLEWFKFEFFKWVDSPSCENCPESKCTMAKMLTPTNEEMRWDAHRVEGHQCNSCGSMARFPRYNNPEKLLETRGGRCGEWANCFSLLCRSLGYDTRHVLDWTDHVWTEIYSKSVQRWVHCDPCENAFDKPLVYEQGWGKKLSLLIAASCDEVVDVTWRYSDKPNDLMPRRNALFREKWLENVLKNLNVKRQEYFTIERKTELENRRVKELLEFNSPKTTSSVVYGGRTTGSVAWRTARGEMGDDKIEKEERALCPKTYSGITDNEFVLKYFSKLDEYDCSLDHDKSGWQSLTYASSCIRRKEELDWKQVYLARTESSQKGHICWKFDLKYLDKQVIIKSATIKAESTVFESGKVNWLLCTDKKTVPLCSDRSQSFSYEVCGARTISIHAFLIGGNGENAWQHTQLFRTGTESDVDNPQFTLSIKYGLK